MKTTFTALLIAVSLSAEANIIEKIKNVLGLSKPVPTISIPALPNVDTDSKQVLKEKRLKNSIEYSEKKANKYNYSYINELHLLVHQKSPSREFIGKWLNVLGQGGSREGVYRSLVLDRNYLALENYKSTITEKTALFTIDFMERFLGSTLAKDKVMAANVYTVSRSIIEKSLEVLDVLFMRPGDDVYDWYAVFSSEIAKNYPDVWSIKTRAMKSADDHKLWAKNVPDDYIKSEVIIKLSKVLKFLESN